MTESMPTSRLSQSVFVKLAAIMLATTATLLILVTGFFAVVVFPSTTLVTHRVVAEYARMLAATSPDLKAAKELRERIYVQTRYEGPRGSWSTDDALPAIAEAKRAHAHSISGSYYHMEPAPGGGTYLFSWNIGELTRAAHIKLLWLLSLLMVAVVFIAYYFQKRLLRPLRVLGDGVSRLGADDLNIVLPVTTRDEFGTLTDGFNRMAARVREMVQARNQLLMDVSHELRSPITRMKVALELSEDDEMKSSMTADLNEMEAMIAELLELERLRDGRALRRECHDILPILREAVRNFENIRPGVRLDSFPETLPLSIDADKIRTVLRNVLENATKYSLPDSKPIAVSVEQNGRHAVIRIRDDGPGIPEADIASLFEPFFRVDRSRSKKTGGYGLGLSICRRIMEGHGGSISVENNVGRGVSFLLTLPAKFQDL